MLDPAEVGKHNGTIVEEQWNGLRVEGSEVLESVNGVECVTRNAIVPLMPNAIILRVCSSRQRGAEVALVTKSLLGQLVGQTNWTRSHFSSGRERLYLNAAIATVIALGVGEFVLFAFRRRVQRGAILVLGVVFIACGLIFEGTQTRHALMLAGGLRFIGIIGLALGVADMVIPRKPKSDLPGASADDSRVSTG